MSLLHKTKLPALPTSCHTPYSPWKNIKWLWYRYNIILDGSYHQLFSYNCNQNIRILNIPDSGTQYHWKMFCQNRTSISFNFDVYQMSSTYPIRLRNSENVKNNFIKLHRIKSDSFKCFMGFFFIKTLIIVCISFLSWAF